MRHQLLLEFLSEPVRLQFCRFGTVQVILALLKLFFLFLDFLHVLCLQRCIELVPLTRGLQLLGSVRFKQLLGVQHLADFRVLSELGFSVLVKLDALGQRET